MNEYSSKKQLINQWINLDNIKNVLRHTCNLVDPTHFYLFCFFSFLDMQL